MSSVTLTPRDRAELAREVASELRPAIEELIGQPPRLLDKLELADRLGCSVSMVEKQQRAGMPSLSIGARRVYHYAAVLEWLQSREEVANGTPKES